jgi:glutamate-1-semialdehyde aminotransferase
MDEYRRKPVHRHLWTQGRKLVEGFAEAGRRHGVPLDCTGLAPMACPRFAYPDPALNGDVWSLFLQETARQGVLIRRGGLLFVTYSHGDEEIDETLRVVDSALAVVADAVASGSVKAHLTGPPPEEAFRRFR